MANGCTDMTSLVVLVVNLDSEADDNYTSSFPIVLLLVYRINDSNP